MADSSRHAQAQLALAMSRSMQQMMQAQAARENRIGNQVVHDGVATGFVNLAGPGESTATVKFPITFTEKPVFTFGFELGPSSWVEQGNFPLGAAVVTRWTLQELNDHTTWVGAALAITLVGVQGPAVLHYHFAGRSLANPTGTP